MPKRLFFLRAKARTLAIPAVGDAKPQVLSPEDGHQTPAPPSTHTSDDIVKHEAITAALTDTESIPSSGSPLVTCHSAVTQMPELPAATVDTAAPLFEYERYYSSEEFMRACRRAQDARRKCISNQREEKDESVEGVAVQPERAHAKFLSRRSMIFPAQQAQTSASSQSKEDRWRPVESNHTRDGASQADHCIDAKPVTRLGVRKTRREPSRLSRIFNA